MRAQSQEIGVLRMNLPTKPAEVRKLITAFRWSNCSWASLAMRYLMLAPLIIFAAESLAQSVDIAPLPEAGHSTIGYQSVSEALTALQQKPGAQMRQQGGWTIISDVEGSNSVLWSFAPESDPAYPAVAKRTVLEKDGAIYINLNVQCGASKSACDKFTRDFQALNEQIKQNFEQRRK